MKDDLIYLQHILEAIEEIEIYLKGIDYDSFIKNNMMINATLKELEIIGEASHNLSDKFKREHPKIPFCEIKAMRNFLIHGYFGVNLKVVWKTCKENLPELKKEIKSILH